LARPKSKDAVDGVAPQSNRHPKPLVIIGRFGWHRMTPLPAALNRIEVAARLKELFADIASAQPSPGTSVLLKSSLLASQSLPAL
jgi:hypothetical protein